MARTISSVLRLRAGFQILFSACTHTRDADAKRLMGDAIVTLLREIKDGKDDLMQLWEVHRLPIDGRINTYWNPGVSPKDSSEKGKNVSSD